VKHDKHQTIPEISYILFVPNFFRIAQPLTKLLKNKFDWQENQDQASLQL